MSARRLERSWLLMLTVALPAAALVRAPRPEPISSEPPPRAAADSFPHEQHAGLFPLCTGCHAGVLTGAAAAVFPGRSLCVQCHDGTDQKTVPWQGPAARLSNLRFDHAAHARDLARAGDTEPRCEGCHAASAAERMRVARPDPSSRCLTCHQHAAEDHFVDAKCATCHAPLAQTRFTRARIEALPEPTDHDDSEFLIRGHGVAATASSARCATCHVQQRCTACHVTPTQSAIRAVPPAPAGMELPVFAARYVAPATHRATDWIEVHGPHASASACGTCHTRNDCTVCHQSTVPQPAAALPERTASAAPGVGIRLRAPDSHRDRFFATAHGTLAAARPASCATCHSGGFCSECHAQAMRLETGAVGTALPPRLVTLLRSGFASMGGGVAATVRPRSTPRPLSTPDTAGLRPPGTRAGFHPADFALRHAGAAYGQTMECATCHSVEAFCKTCHQEAGLATVTRAGPGFHGTGAAWLLGHGQPARQGLESCASCHRQKDCVQCHSTIGSFRVNPHGPSFNAAAAGARAPETCLACHLEPPLSR